MVQRKVTIVGSGNWGSAIARIIGQTVIQHPKQFDSKVLMWVYEEIVEGRKLSEVINTEHENVKYLPGKKLPVNVIAETDLIKSCKEADVLVFVVPHQHINRICTQLKGQINPTAVAISLIKGLSESGPEGIRLVSEEIAETLGIEVAVLMGANLAPEVANNMFCEATVGCCNPANGPMLKMLFHSDNFRINVVREVPAVELCGALKNVVACAAGFADGMSMGDNTKAALIRLGMMEIMDYVKHFYPGSSQRIFFESCGIADLVTTCYGGRNRRVCEAFVKTRKPLGEIEHELLNGQSAQGPPTAVDLYQTLTMHNLVERFPLFVAVHRICKGEMPPEDLIDAVRHHPNYAQEMI